MRRTRSSRGGVDAAPREGLVLPGRELSGPADWSRQFGRSAELIVEIGFGKDPFLLDRAAACPEGNHVGIERDLGRAGRFLDEAHERGLKNVRALPITAELALGSCFVDGAISELHVYFPDPWPKERHAENRMVRPWFGQAVARTLAGDGRLFMATDDAPYADQIREVMAGAGLCLLASGHGRSDHETKFERLWRSQGRHIQSMQFAPTSPARKTVHAS